LNLQKTRQRVFCFVHDAVRQAGFELLFFYSRLKFICNPSFLEHTRGFGIGVGHTLFEGLSEAAEAAERERPRSSAERVPEKRVCTAPMPNPPFHLK
jgi:hypothetical protein